MQPIKMAGNLEITSIIYNYLGPQSGTNPCYIQNLETD